jgi:hypothetical protein
MFHVKEENTFGPSNDAELAAARERGVAWWEPSVDDWLQFEQHEWPKLKAMAKRDFTVDGGPYASFFTLHQYAQKWSKISRLGCRYNAKDDPQIDGAGILGNDMTLDGNTGDDDECSEFDVTLLDDAVRRE